MAQRPERKRIHSEDNDVIMEQNRRKSKRTELPVTMGSACNLDKNTNTFGAESKGNEIPNPPKTRKRSQELPEGTKETRSSKKLKGEEPTKPSDSTEVKELKCPNNCKASKQRNENKEKIEGADEGEKQAVLIAPKQADEIKEREEAKKPHKDQEHKSNTVAPSEQKEQQNTNAPNKQTESQFSKELRQIDELINKSTKNKNKKKSTRKNAQKNNKKKHTSQKKQKPKRKVKGPPWVILTEMPKTSKRDKKNKAKDSVKKKRQVKKKRTEEKGNKNIEGKEPMRLRYRKDQKNNMEQKERVNVKINEPQTQDKKKEENKIEKYIKIAEPKEPVKLRLKKERKLSNEQQQNLAASAGMELDAKQHEKKEIKEPKKYILRYRKEQKYSEEQKERMDIEVKQDEQKKIEKPRVLRDRKELKEKKEMKKLP